MATLLGN